MTAFSTSNTVDTLPKLSELPLHPPHYTPANLHLVHWPPHHMGIPRGIRRRQLTQSHTPDPSHAPKLFSQQQQASAASPSCMLCCPSPPRHHPQVQIVPVHSSLLRFEQLLQFACQWCTPASQLSPQTPPSCWRALTPGLQGATALRAPAPGAPGRAPCESCPARCRGVRCCTSERAHTHTDPCEHRVDRNRVAMCVSVSTHAHTCTHVRTLEQCCSCVSTVSGKTNTQPLPTQCEGVTAFPPTPTVLCPGV